ncbi:MAG: hypothetical protein LIR50_17550 [Bacillota bacterium]|nr:hypothetical protein [Bacillota bacterium]
MVIKCKDYDKNRKDCLNCNDYYKRYEIMEKDAGEQELGMDFREDVGDLIGQSLKAGRYNMTLAEILTEIEKSWWPLDE